MSVCPRWLSCSIKLLPIRPAPPVTMIMFQVIPVISFFTSDRRNLSLLRCCGYCQANRRRSEGQGLTSAHSHLLLQRLPDLRGA